MPEVPVLLKSPARHKSLSPPPRRTKAPPSLGSKVDPAFRRPSQTAGRLWDPSQTVASPRTKLAAKPKRVDVGQVRSARSLTYEEPPPNDESTSTHLIKQPETRPISQEQLVAEIKGIYAGLVMIESKCIEVHKALNSKNGVKLKNEQWQALIALHRTLLHEHHDFFLASQHPSASPALQRLASKYAMPARMWRHGIHSFLELLRHGLPGSLEHMLTFIYLVYSMMALLYETVPTFEDTWIECLGDLGRYRMAIEDDDCDREVWTSVSRHWYSKASDKAPTTGRLYHHLAILARPNALLQLFYYTKSLCVPVPFTSARESIMTLFDPILNSNHTNSRLTQIDAAFVKAHGILFSGKCVDDFTPTAKEFIDNLDNHIGRITRRWMESGYYIGIANCCALLDYGKEENSIYRAIRPQRLDEPAEPNVETAAAPDKTFKEALYLAEGTHDIVFRRFADPNVLPYFHVVLVFVYHLTYYPSIMTLIDRTFPWKLVSMLLNSLLLSYRDYTRIQSEDFPKPEKELPRPLPEDFAMNGLLWVDRYFPLDWFSNDRIDDDEKYFEVASMTDKRKERILWLASRIAGHGKWLLYDETIHQFSVAPEFEVDISTLTRDVGDSEMNNVSETDSVSRLLGATATEQAPSEDPQMTDVGDTAETVTTTSYV
ncbi:hypothetical protein BX600DRAFT_70331 [Xylariales sp. PMI_506]|nr:hypothetical protein BX600DRAFT_70331 [Xylariales sp. PMI_506]